MYRVFFRGVELRVHGEFYLGLCEAPPYMAHDTFRLSKVMIYQGSDITNILSPEDKIMIEHYVARHY